ncbi:solute carrier family 52, riboflavin transporter, member 3-A isoform X2 [Siphateles boraxobius]|uniref:solute carrier family 52, riboflavin transporter, member 3-A isoform X2 n=1 Tax=Siphateles boraxobius TaxID=180520 RepID=UPI0040648EDB
MPLYIHALACAFGLGSWVSINGLWVELPLIVNVLPEGWDLPSYLTVIIQLANFGPLLVTLAHKFCPGRLRENLVIYAVLSIGVVACVLLAAFWKNTTMVLGQPRSTAFFILTFFLALVDCTSSVTFLPFMMQLPAKYITTYFIGEGLSGLVPGLVALAQGVGMSKCVNVSHVSDNLTDPEPPTFIVETQYLPPNFSTEIFFSFLAVMTAISLGAFLILNRLPRTFELSTENLVPDSDAVATNCSGLEGPVDPNPKTNRQEEEEKKQIRVLLPKPLHSDYQLAFIYFMVFISVSGRPVSAGVCIWRLQYGHGCHESLPITPKYTSRGRYYSFVMGFLYWPAVLCEGDGRCDTEGPESQRPRVVWSSSADRIFVGLLHYVSPG